MVPLVTQWYNDLPLCDMEMMMMLDDSVREIRNSDTPLSFVVDADQASDWSGIQICTIDVKNGDKVARFWVRLHVTKGRPKVTVTTKINNMFREISKAVTGVFSILSR